MAPRFTRAPTPTTSTRSGSRCMSTPGGSAPSTSSASTRSTRTTTRGHAPLGVQGGAARGQKKAPAPKALWQSYETWEALSADVGAVDQYLAQRAQVLNNPDLDWKPVLDEVIPKLTENHEYIGLVNVEPDGKTLRLVASEASPVEAGTTESDTTFASVPASLVAKYAGRPAMFIFHTHPADPRGSPFPSSHDLSTSIYFAAATRFAANVVISRYGVFVYGLDWDGYKAVNEAKDPKLAILNLSHDVVAAHEAVRSWSAHTIRDYLDFYVRHRLFVFVFPSPEMVGDGRRFTYMWNLESPIDHEVIEAHRADIASHQEESKTGKPRPRRKTQASRGQAFRILPGAEVGLD